MRYLSTGLLIATLALGITTQADAHCQIPCGIYDDELRVQLIEEHITTVEKSMNQIVALGKESPVNYNQLVRWIDNKEQHAQEIQDIVADYFLCQRIKMPESKDGKPWEQYVAQLTTLHQIQVAAMKAKQTTDLANVEALKSLVAAFRTAYFGEAAGHSH
jgi:nickel superoxide dismutase